MKKAVLIFTIVAFATMSIFFLSRQNKNEQEASASSLVPEKSISHGHGLAIDVADSNKVYIATHYGLLVLTNDKELFRIGKSRDDYMGFTVHPTDSKVFLSSGHPASGGNIGFQKSEDGGFTWNKISDGVKGPVDFHAMAVSLVNPDLIYGWFRGDLQRSSDRGKTWEIVASSGFPIINLATDPTDENVVYAASPQGLMVSSDKGKEWTSLLDGFVSAIAINPQDSQKLLSFSEKNELAKSSDGGANWEPISESFGGETPLFIVFSRQDSLIVYSLTEKNSIYKSTNEGNNWSRVF